MEKEIEIMTADELLATRKTVEINDVMSIFQEQYNFDKAEISFVGLYLSDEVKLQLFNLGFKYRKHLGPIGETCHVISLK